MNHLRKKALRYAAQKHDGQYRKTTAIPYIVHPIEVASRLVAWEADADTIIAGLLHDTLEDTDTTFNDLHTQFGPRVASIVLEVTEQSKKRILNRVPYYSLEAALVKAADVCSNISDINNDYKELGDAVFDRFVHSKSIILNHYRVVAMMLKGRFFPVGPVRDSLTRVINVIDSME